MISEKILGFDMDGVLCADLDLPWDHESFDYKIMHETRMRMHPTFIPTGPFVIITGRPVADMVETQKWLDKFNILPQKIYYNKQDPSNWKNVARHKADTILMLKDKLSLFVESSHDQVEYIRQFTYNIIPVFHFSDFIANKFYEEQNRL